MKKDIPAYQKSEELGFFSWVHKVTRPLYMSRQRLTPLPAWFLDVLLFKPNAIMNDYACLFHSCAWLINCRRRGVCASFFVSNTISLYISGWKGIALIYSRERPSLRTSSKERNIVS